MGGDCRAVGPFSPRGTPVRLYYHCAVTLTSVQRRRRWSRSEKERIVTAALESGAVASEVARAAGIHTSQLFRWRRSSVNGRNFRPATEIEALVPRSAAILRKYAGFTPREIASGEQLSP